ncbi:purine nucleosidase [Malassezia pachydermatis]
MNGRPIPVGLGASKPLGGRLFTASYFHGRDGMSGVSFMEGDPYPESKTSKLFHTSPSPLSAADLILDILRKHEPHTVRIAAVAPLTNLALAYQKDPVTFRRVGMISIMGGAIDVPGNTSPTAEFNFFADPWAAKVLLVDSYYQGTPLPIHLFPLDTTTVHTVPYSKLVLDETHSLYQKSYLVRLISLFLRKPRAVTNSHAPHDKPFDPSKYDLFEAHDPLAVAHAIFGSDTERWGANPRQFLIETEGQLTRGFCVVEYVTAVDLPLAAAIWAKITLAASKRMWHRYRALPMKLAHPRAPAPKKRWTMSHTSQNLCLPFLLSTRHLARCGSLI